LFCLQAEERLVLVYDGLAGGWAKQSRSGMYVHCTEPGRNAG
jgi:hypothetical protein